MLVVICCMAGIAAADEKNILVTSGSDRATPIAVVPFGWQGGSVLPDDMSQIVSDDLRNSGYYAPIRQRQHDQPADPGQRSHLP
jgi:TolB protein